MLRTGLAAIHAALLAVKPGEIVAGLGHPCGFSWSSAIPRSTHTSASSGLRPNDEHGEPGLSGEGGEDRNVSRGEIEHA
jgi:hypothetical protein